MMGTFRPVRASIRRKFSSTYCFVGGFVTEETPFPFRVALGQDEKGGRLSGLPLKLEPSRDIPETPAQPLPAVGDEPLEAGHEEFGAFRIEGVLAAGGMSVVYRAAHQATGEVVALKLLRPSVASNQLLVDAMFREAQTLHRLSHPGIVNVLGYGVHAGKPFVVLELVDGVALSQLMRMLDLSREQLRHLVKHVCAAVAYLHKEGFLHCDLKPSHIYVSREGAVKLIDFGLVCDCNGATSEALRFGTGPYVAPELIAGTHYPTPASDIYALAVTFYRLFTTQLPDPTQLKKASELNPDLPAAVDAVFARALAVVPEERFSSVDEFAEELLKALG
ncbi:MAG: serine/threonine protein kinase [Candidatus Hydrogenedentota bacterium]|nr:MAG: serine/threonine protein kinase [Candidatus Hydrogenedentota bacterium]